MRIEVDRQLWRMVGVLGLPTAATRPNDPVAFRVEHLPGSGHGPMIDRDALRRWGLASAPAWRAFLRLAYVWDKAKAANNGARIYATRPVVARGPGGVILGADGKPLRNRRGAVVTDWSDRRAVHLGANRKPAGAGNPSAWELNPAADRVPVLGPDDLIRLAFDGDLDTNRRKRLHLARKVAAAFEGGRIGGGRGGRRRVAADRAAPRSTVTGAGVRYVATLGALRGNAGCATWQRWVRYVATPTRIIACTATPMQCAPSAPRLHSR